MVMAVKANITNALDGMSVNQWIELPATTIYGGVYLSRAGSGSVFAYSGALYDTKRNRLVVIGGGHNDWGGNEHYALKVNQVNPAWMLSYAGSPNDQIRDIQGDRYETNLDGLPASRHTYQGLVYHAARDEYFLFGGLLWCGTGDASAYTWGYNPNTNAWTRYDDLPYVVTVDAVYDPQFRLIWAAGGSPGNFPLYQFDPSAGTGSQWTMRDTTNTNLGCFALDTSRRRLFTVGAGATAYWTLALSGNLTRTTMDTTGVTPPNGWAGLAYDPIADKIVGWEGGQTIFTLTQDGEGGGVWANPSVTGATPTAANNYGPFGRFQYVPTKNRFIGVNAVTDNVFAFRLS